MIEGPFELYLTPTHKLSPHLHKELEVNFGARARFHCSVSIISDILLLQIILILCDHMAETKSRSTYK